MYRTILVPVDGSKRAEAIFRHVENLAKGSDAKVVLLKVEEEPIMLGRDEVIDIIRAEVADGERAAFEFVGLHLAAARAALVEEMTAAMAHYRTADGMAFPGGSYTVVARG